MTEYVASTPAGMFDKLLPVDELAPFERLQQRTVEVPMPRILKEIVEVTDSLSLAPAVTNTVPGPLTKKLAPTRETGPMIKFVAPSPAVSSREEEIIDIARCLDELKRQCAEVGMQHPMIPTLEIRLAALSCLQSRAPCTRWLTACPGRYFNTGRRSAASAATGD